MIQGWATHSWISGDQAVRRTAAVQLLQSGASKVAEKVAGQILALNREGKNQRQIADLVGLSVTTVRPVLGLTEAEPVELKDDSAQPLVAVAPPAPRTEERRAARAGCWLRPSGSSPKGRSCREGTPFGDPGVTPCR